VSDDIGRVGVVQNFTGDRTGTGVPVAPGGLVTN